MINYRYPKDIIDEVALRDDISEDVKSDFATGSFSFEISDKFLISHGKDLLHSAKKYMFFLEQMRGTFIAIHSNFNKRLPEDDPGLSHDMYITGSFVEEMLAISSYLYILNSYGIPGDVLECGCFKGFSSCCLSVACDYLGKKLIVADSFYGLPDSDGYYKVGEYAGSLEEVQRNIDIYGRISCVEFVKGYFEESLKGFSRQLCAIWMDVDLYSSVSDVLHNAFSALSQGGLLFSHEMAEAFFDNVSLRYNVARNELPEALGLGTFPAYEALRDYFSGKELLSSALFLVGYTAVFAFSGLPITTSSALDSAIMCVYIESNISKDIDVYAISQFYSNFKHIYIYGAGYKATDMVVKMQKHQMEIDGFVVSDGQQKRDRLFGYDVCFFSELAGPNSDMGIIIAMDDIYAKEVHPHLISKGYNVLLSQKDRR